MVHNTAFKFGGSTSYQTTHIKTYLDIIPDSFLRYLPIQSSFKTWISSSLLCDFFDQSILVDGHLRFQFLGNDKISVFDKIGYFVIILERDLKTQFIFNDLEHWCEADYSANSLIKSDLQSLNLNNPHILNFKKSPEKISLYFVQQTLFLSIFVKLLWNKVFLSKIAGFGEMDESSKNGRSSFLDHLISLRSVIKLISCPIVTFWFNGPES